MYIQPIPKVESAEQLLRLGTIYFMQKDFASALDVFERALDMFDSRTALTNPIVGELLVHTGNTYGKLKRYRQAISHYRLAALVFMRVYGAHHPNVALAESKAAEVESAMLEETTVVAVLQDLAEKWQQHCTLPVLRSSMHGHKQAS